MGFSRQEYRRGLPFPPDSPDPGIKPGSPALQADSSLSELPEQLGKKKKKKETMSKSPLSKCKWFNAQIAIWAQMLIMSTFYERCISMNSLNWLFVQVELNLLKRKSVLQLESPVWLSKSEFWSIAKFPRNLSGAFSRWLVADVYFSKWNKFTNYISNQIL